MSDKLFRAVTMALTVITVVLLLHAGREIFESNYPYSYEEDSLIYYVQEGNYSLLRESCARNREVGVKETKSMTECYAVADYYQAAMLYYTYRETGQTKRREEAGRRMETAAEQMGDFSYCAEEIKNLFENYLAEH